MNCRDIDGMLVEGSLGFAFFDRCRGSRERLRPLPVTRECDQNVHSDGRAFTRRRSVHIESCVIADLRPVRPLGSRLYVFAALIAIFVFVVAVRFTVWALSRSR